MKNSITLHLDNDLLDHLAKAVKEAVKEEVPKMKDSFQKEWLTTEEVMEMLSCSRRTVQNYRDEGKIPYTQEGRKILYPRSGIEQFLRENMIKAYR
ncbi:helix-turn-helix domain-containing protein [Aliifodinibius sp. S!AR15-10]|uniref:helix-turn-helix domain-containing protein n=1 Tax=Aliifodinibius sp. S!AR15-10 TaxID=2950437 RepID=UPI00285ED37B|nr:helix-turn-helix domain-containing protein [Aliifodinibius sp. S!AR15-10]MDR8394451.1 helix-turn-helix domain-containing protein [Aliifodinibius sp. S!AR15-10]